MEHRSRRSNQNRRLTTASPAPALCSKRHLARTHDRPHRHPLKAGTHTAWVPTFAGMTVVFAGMTVVGGICSIMPLLSRHRHVPSPGSAGPPPRDRRVLLFGIESNSYGSTRLKRDSETLMRQSSSILCTRFAGVAWPASAKADETGIAVKACRDPGLRQSPLRTVPHSATTYLGTEPRDVNDTTRRR